MGELIPAMETVVDLETGGTTPEPRMSVAEANALTESFQILTSKLVVLHRQALAGVADGAIPPQVRQEIFALMKEAFVDTQDSDPTKVFNFMIYLISVISQAEEMDTTVEAWINQLAHSVNEFALAIGMQPVNGGADGQNPQRQAS